VQYPSEDKHEIEDLARVASYYVELNGQYRMGLLEELRECLGHAYEFGRLHALLAALPGHHLFVVTNYDVMLEQAFKAAQKPYDLVVYPTATDRPDLAAAVLWWPHGAAAANAVAPDQLVIDLTTTTVIFKMHGTLPADSPPDGDTCVITEEDYAEFLARMTQSQAIPTIFHRHFHARSFLFLGYSLRDWNLRVLLHNLRLPTAPTDDPAAGAARRRPPDSWAIQYMPSAFEREVWRSRGVRIFHEDLDRFAGELERERDSDVPRG